MKSNKIFSSDNSNNDDAVEGVYAAKKSSTGEYVDDSVITAKVKFALLHESLIKSFDINVETFNGMVQLSGFVDNQATINKAETVAREVPGVKSVSNELCLK